VTLDLRFHSQNNDVTNAGTYFVTDIFSKTYVATDYHMQLPVNVNIAYGRFDPILLVGDDLIFGDKLCQSIKTNFN